MFSFHIPSDTARNVCTKEAAFAEHYDTVNKTNEQVLSEFSSVSFLFFFIMKQNTTLGLCVWLALIVSVSSYYIRKLWRVISGDMNPQNAL